MGDLCMWCDRPSTRLCDAPIGFEATGAIRDKQFHLTGLLTGRSKAGDNFPTMWTCDAPMCDQHATQTGFICGSSPDSIDRCPYHTEQPHGQSMPELIMFEAEAETKRREVHAAIRRGRMAQSGQEQ